jgi:hypothetical protein
MSDNYLFCAEEAKLFYNILINGHEQQLLQMEFECFLQFLALLLEVRV